MSIFLFFSFVFGAMIGSFINVVIYRVPLKMSVVTPRSTCPSCKKLIYWYENIPILSYLFLRGKCGVCKFKIPLSYPGVELCLGIASLLFFYNIKDSLDIKLYLFNYTIFVIFFTLFIIDIKHKLLPDVLNLYLAIFLFLYAIFKFSPWHIAFGALIGGGFPFLVTWIFYKLRGQIGLGGGDIKLYAALGLYLGPVDIIYTIFLSCFLGAVIGVVLIQMKVMKRNSAMAFGPFILVVASVQFFLPDIYAQIKGLIS